MLQDKDKMKSPSNILSIVKVPNAAASGAGNLRWTPSRTSIRPLWSTNVSAEPTALPPTSDIGS